MEIWTDQIGFGIPAWGPSRKTRSLLATGTHAGSTEEDSLLRILKYDINSADTVEMQAVTKSPTKFSSLDWIDFADPSGIIAGGMADGAITLWDPKKIMDGQSTMENLRLGKGCVSATKIHKGVPVGSIEFNPHKKNLLASGGSEVLIQDISSNLKQPTVFTPGVPNYHEGSRITSISWNRIVQHILASASEDGKIVVWDLKVNKSVFNFTEPSSGSAGMDDYFGGQDTSQPPTPKETQMMWNPQIPTQFVVANDDDKNPSINIWDLRNPGYPVATFNDIHYSGILSFSWCLSDPSLVISSGKDNRTVVTNFKTGEQVLEFPTQSLYKRVRWSNQLHGKICAMTDEGKSSVLSFEPEGLYSNPGRPFATPNILQSSNEPYVPKWMQPRCGAAFGFGNKLVTFSHQKKGLLSVHKASNEVLTNLSRKVQEFDSQLESIPMTQICDIKSKSAQNDYDMMEFKVLKCLLEDNYDALLKQFGIDKNKAVFEVERFLGRKLNRQKESEQQVAPKPVQNTVIQSNLPAMSAEGAADFFSQLGQKDQQPNQANQSSGPSDRASGGGNSNQIQPSAASGLGDDQRAPNARMHTIQETVSRNINWDEGAEGIIKQNLLIGELEYAAEVALKCGRTTEALLIAEAGGAELYERIKASFFAQQKDQYVRDVIQAVTKNDFTSIIESVTRPDYSMQMQQQPHHCNWKETLAYVIAYQDDAKLKEVAKRLGDQLFEAKTDINSAIVCYILSNEMDIVTDLWKKRALYQIRKLGINKYEALFLLFQKTIILRAACKQPNTTNEDMDLILADFAEYLNVESMSFTAMKHMQQTQNVRPEVADVKYRIYTSSLEVQQAFHAPPVSFQVEQVRPQVVPQQQQMAQKHQQARAPMQQHMGGQPQMQAPQQMGRMGQQQPPMNPAQMNQRFPPQQPMQQQPNKQMQGPGAMQMNPGNQNPGMNYQNQVQQTQQQLGQMSTQPGGAGTQPQNANLLPPRFQDEGNVSMHANHGYNNQTKPPVQVDQAQQMRTDKKPANTQRQMPTQGASQNIKVLRPGPGDLNPNQGAPKTAGGRAPLPSLRSPMPNVGPAQGPGSQGPPTAFNPAVATSYKPQAPPQQESGPPTRSTHQVIRPQPAPRAPPTQQHHQPPMGGGQMQQPPPSNFPGQPPMNPGMHNPNMPGRHAGGPPPARQQQSMFAPPPMGMNQPPPQQPQQMSAPPMAPPKGSGSGPKPMSAMMGPPPGGAQMGASAASVNPSDLVNAYQAMFQQFIQVETNQKVKAETENKLAIMVEKVNNGQLNAMTVEKLHNICVLIQQGNGPASKAALQDLTQKAWNDIKDFQGAIKVLVNFKQKYGVQ